MSIYLDRNESGGSGSGLTTIEANLDMGSAYTLHVPAPSAGTLVRIHASINGSALGADETITFSDFSGSSMGSMVFLSGSDDKSYQVIYPTSNNEFGYNQSVQVTTDGLGSAGNEAVILFEFDTDPNYAVRFQSNQKGLNNTMPDIQLQEFTVTGRIRNQFWTSGNDGLFNTGSYTVNGWSIRRSGSLGSLFFWIPEYTTVIAAFDPLEWTTFEASVSGGIMSLSVNGGAPVTAGGIGAITYGTQAANLGSLGGAQSWEGDIDRLTIKDGSDVLVADWQMSDGDGTTITDDSGNGNDFIIQNYASGIWVPVD